MNTENKYTDTQINNINSDIVTESDSKNNTNHNDLAMKENLEIIQSFSNIMKSLFTGLAAASQNIIEETKTTRREFNNRTNALSSNAIDIANDVSKTLKNATLDLIGQFLPVIEKSITGEYANMSSEDATKNINDVLIRQKNLFLNLSQNEELQKALQEWIQAYADVGIQAIRISKPSLDIIIEEFWNSTNDVLVKSIQAIINIAFNVGKSAISTIPIGGAAFVLFFSFIEGIHKGMLISASPIKSGTKNLIITKNT